MPLHHLLDGPTTSCLLQQIGGGSRSAFGTLYDRIAPNVFAAAIAILGSRATAELATGAVFLTIGRTSPQYTATDDHAGTWLSVLVREAFSATRNEEHAALGH